MIIRILDKLMEASDCTTRIPALNKERECSKDMIGKSLQSIRYMLAAQSYGIVTWAEGI